MQKTFSDYGTEFDRTTPRISSAMYYVDAITTYMRAVVNVIHAHGWHQSNNGTLVRDFLANHEYPGAFRQHH